jgi:hypothetical protein
VAGLPLHVRSPKGSKKEVGGVQPGSNHLVNNPDRVFGTDRLARRPPQSGTTQRKKGLTAILQSFYCIATLIQ